MLRYDPCMRQPAWYLDATAQRGKQTDIPCVAPGCLREGRYRWVRTAGRRGIDALVCPLCGDFWTRDLWALQANPHGANRVTPSKPKR